VVERPPKVQFDLLIQMATFKVTYGVGGGYNDIRTEVLEFDTFEEAEQYAYESSVEVYESYGIFEEDEECTEDEESTEDDYETMHQESIERWVSYSAVEVPESNESM
jgi:hypothetical protein